MQLVPAREPKNTGTYEVSMDSSINPFAGLMYITFIVNIHISKYKKGEYV